MNSVVIGTYSETASAVSSSHLILRLDNLFTRIRMIQDICNAKKSTDTNAEVHLPVNTVGYIRALPRMDLSLSHLEVASKI